MLLRSFMYFLMMFKSEVTVTLLVIMSSSLLLEWIKLTKISDLTPLLILDIWVFAFTITLSALFNPIGTVTCFLDRPLIVMLSLGLSFWSKFNITLWILEILFIESFWNTFLIFKKFWMLFLETWAYKGLLLCLFKFDLAKTLLLG